MADESEAKRENEEEGCPPTKKRKRVNKERDPDLTQQMHSETSYYIKNGLRCVVPYCFTFKSYVKRRWVGSTVYDVLCREFQAEQPEYYESAIKTGKVTVNGKAVTMTTVLRDNDLLAHRVHRHEPPVSAQAVEIVHEDNDILVVNKPSSIPVHTCGRYRHNTMVFILSKEFGQKDLKTSHRLDRLTSGLLIFAKHLGAAQRIEAEIRDRKVEKEYVCRVAGEFPETPVECSEPILVVCKKLGVCKVDPAGKPCSTLFTRISYNGTSSVVTCVPRTGRMHQIRVHLQWLGYPIVNDPLYNNKAWGPKCGALGKGTENMEQVIQEITALNYSSELSCVQEVTADYKPADPLADCKDLVVGTRDACNMTSHPDSTGMACRNCTAENRFEVTAIAGIGRGQVVDCSGPQIKTVQPLLDSDSEISTEVESAPIPTSVTTPTPATDPASTPATDPAPTPATDPTPTPTTDPAPTPATDPTPTPATDPAPTLATNPTPTPATDPASTLATDPTPTPTSGPTPTPGPTPPMNTIDPTPTSATDPTPTSTTDPTPTWTVDPSCTECAVRRPDPEPKDLVMYLHAVSYKGANWEYRTDLPYWASEDFTE